MGETIYQRIERMNRSDIRVLIEMLNEILNARLDENGRERENAAIVTFVEVLQDPPITVRELEEKE